MEEQPNKRRLQAKSTKASLFDSAIALFREKGYGAVSVDEITRRAGTSKGSFYTHFRKKSDILVEEFRTIDDYYRRVSKGLSKYPDEVQKLKAFTKAQCKYVRDSVGLDMLRILIMANVAEAADQKSLIDTTRYLHELIKGLIREGQRSGSIRSDMPADRLATLYNRGIRAVLLDWVISEASFDLVQGSEEFFEAMIAPGLIAGARAAPSDTAPRGAAPPSAGE